MTVRITTPGPHYDWFYDVRGARVFDGYLIMNIGQVVTPVAVWLRNGWTAALVCASEADVADALREERDAQQPLNLDTARRI